MWQIVDLEKILCYYLSKRGGFADPENIVTKEKMR
jgi:hypothetical protein